MASTATPVFDLATRRSSCSHCGAHALCLGSSLEDSSRHDLQDIKGPSHLLRRGEHLVMAGDKIRSLYVVRSGSLKSYVITDEGEEQIVGFHLPGDTIGFEALAYGRASWNVAALETCNVCFLPGDALWRLSDESRTLRKRLFQGMSRELLRMTEMLQLERRTADQRVASFLLSQSRHFASRGYSTSVFSLSMSRREIGKFLDLATETVSRVFTRFQQDGLVRAQRNQVQILDMERLDHTAGPAAEDDARAVRTS